MSQSLNKQPSKKEIAYFQYVKEAKNYFVTSFLTSEKIKEKITEALNVIFDFDGKHSGKGLMLFGKSYGQGKTLFFEIVFHRVFRVSKTKIWKTISAKDLRVLYTTKGISEVDKFIECKNLFVDDLGEEEETGKNYGDEMNVLRYVILKRYEMWISNGSKLHLTTNLNIQEIANKYDAKVADRLLGMTEIVEFDLLEGSFRQVKTTRRLTEEEKKKPAEKEVNKIYDDGNYYDFLNLLAEEFSNTGELKGRHWTDFWIMHAFFERKGLSMRKITNDDKLAAEIIIKADRKENEPKRISLKDLKDFLSRKDPTQIEKAALSIIGREYFTKLALSKIKFCETLNLSEL